MKDALEEESMIYEPWFYTKESAKISGKAETTDIWYFHHRDEGNKIIWSSVTVKATADEKIQQLNEEERKWLLLHRVVWC
jgi:hypothetical protein